MVYTKAQLMRFNKAELAEMAAMFGIDISTTDGAEPTQADYVEAIDRFAPTSGKAGSEPGPSGPSETFVPPEPSNVSVRVQRIRDAQAAALEPVFEDLALGGDGDVVEPEPEPAPELEPEVEEVIEALNEDGSAVDIYDPETLAHVGSQGIGAEEGSEPEEDFEVEETPFNEELADELAAAGELEIADEPEEEAVDDAED